MGDNAITPESIESELAELSSLDRAAMFMLCVGETSAAEIMRYLEPREVQKIGSAMASLRHVGKRHMQLVLQNFIDVVGGKTGLGGAGTDAYIRNVITAALGEDKASRLIDRILIGKKAEGLESLKLMDANTVAQIISQEHPQIQAIILSYLDADQAGDILSFFPERLRSEVITRISSLKPVHPDAMAELDLVLKRQFAQSESSSSNLGGVKTAAEILNNVTSSIEQSIMEQIDELDSDLAAEITEMMFVFEDLKEVDDRGIQALLREVTSETLILALKGADDDLKEKIFSNMSKRAAELLADDLEAKGPVKVSEVEGAQKEIIGIARRMESAGEISLSSKGGEEML